MREILFRGKRKDYGKWIEGYYLHQNKRQFVNETHYIVSVDGFYHSIDPSTVCQFIGLYDKNGQKIFEGDIIKGKVHEGNGYRVRIGVIEYHDVGFIMNLEPNSWYDQKNISFDCEVIGNIYDSPELLKGGIENG